VAESLVEIIERVKKKIEENPPQNQTLGLYTVGNGNIYLEKIDRKNKIAYWSWNEYKATLQVQNRKPHILSICNISSRGGCNWYDMPADVRQKMTSVIMAIFPETP
jgi:hypothetical protein